MVLIHHCYSFFSLISLKFVDTRASAELSFSYYLFIDYRCLRFFKIFFDCISISLHVFFLKIMCIFLSFLGSHSGGGKFTDFECQINIFISPLTWLNVEFWFQSIFS